MGITFYDKVQLNLSVHHDHWGVSFQVGLYTVVWFLMWQPLVKTDWSQSRTGSRFYLTSQCLFSVFRFPTWVETVIRVTDGGPGQFPTVKMRKFTGGGCWQAPPHTVTWLHQTNWWFVPSWWLNRCLFQLSTGFKEVSKKPIPPK